MKRIGIIIVMMAGMFGMSAQDVLNQEESAYLPDDSIEVDTIQVEEIYKDGETILESEDIEEEEIDSENGDDETIDLDLPDYEAWERLTLQGKLKMQGLPLSPSIKIFMQQDSLIDISVRAPFVGEAARVVVTPDTVTVVNKMKKTFMKEGIKDFLSYYPGGLSDVQDLLLARFFLPGFDVNEAPIEELVDIYYEDDQFNVVPKGEAAIEGVKYGFVVDSAFRPLLLVILPEARPDIEISVNYRYKLQGYDMQFVYQEGSGAKDLTLELKAPEWDGEQPKKLELGSKYKQLSFGNFLRNL